MTFMMNHLYLYSNLLGKTNRNGLILRANDMYYPASSMVLLNCHSLLSQMAYSP